MDRNVVLTVLRIGLFLQVIVASEVASQSVFLKQGASGMGVSGDIDLSESGAGFGIGAGYSIAGLVDFGFSFGRYQYADDA